MTHHPVKRFTQLSDGKFYIKSSHYYFNAAGGVLVPTVQCGDIADKCKQKITNKRKTLGFNAVKTLD